MRKIIALVLVMLLALQLAGCGLFVVDTDSERRERRRDNEKKTVTTEATEAPTEPTEQTTEQTTEATEAPTQPKELTPMTDVPYILNPPAEACVFKEPDANSQFVRAFGHEGAYTIVEERYDENGDLWAKLKSGIGWTNVTNPFCGGPDAPKVVATYASKQVMDGEHHLAALYTNDPYKVNVSILAHETVYRVMIRENDMINERAGKVLYNLEQLDPEKPIVAHLTFPGDFSSFLVTYEDADGVAHEILLWMSMDDSNFIGWF